MKTTSKEATHDEIDQGTVPKIRDQDVIEDQLNEDIKIMPKRESLCAHNRWTESVKKYLEGTGGSRIS